MDAQACVRLCCSQTLEDRFSHVDAHIIQKSEFANRKFVSSSLVQIRNILFPCILIDFPIRINTMRMGLSTIYFKVAQVEIFKQSYTSVPEDCIYLSKQCRP